MKETEKAIVQRKMRVRRTEFLRAIQSTREEWRKKPVPERDDELPPCSICTDAYRRAPSCSGNYCVGCLVTMLFGIRYGGRGSENYYCNCQKILRRVEDQKRKRPVYDILDRMEKAVINA